MQIYLGLVGILSLRSCSVRVSLPYSIQNLDRSNTGIKRAESSHTPVLQLPHPLSGSSILNTSNSVIVSSGHSGETGIASSTLHFPSTTPALSASPSPDISPPPVNSTVSVPVFLNATSTVTETKTSSLQSASSDIGSLRPGSSSLSSSSSSSSSPPSSSSSPSASSDTVLTSTAADDATSGSTTDSKLTPTSVGKPSSSLSHLLGSTVDHTTTIDHTTTMSNSDGSPVTPTAMPEQSHFSFPPAHILDAFIDGQTYHLPSPDEPSMNILLLDGTLAQLFDNKVVMRGQTLTIPNGLSDMQVISSGGQSIQVRPGESKEPDTSGGSSGSSGGGSGGKGGRAVGGFLGGLVGAAGKAAGGLAKAGKDAMDFASGAGGATADGVAGTFAAAVGDVGGVVSSLNGIQKAFPAAQLSKAGVGAAMGALNLGRDSSNWLASMQSMVEGFDSLSPEVQQQARDNMKQYAGAGGPLQKASEAMKAFEDFPWENEVPPTQIPSASKTKAPTSTTDAQATASTAPQTPLTTSGPATDSQTSTTTTSSTTSSTGSGLPEKPTQYFIRTKERTSLNTFRNFIQELDGGVGNSVTYDPALVPHQSYTTMLLPSQAQDLQKRYSFILCVIPIVFDPTKLDWDEENFYVLSRDHHNPSATFRGVSASKKSSTPSAEQEPRALSAPKEDAPYWKKMISSPSRDPPRSPPEDPPYVADDAGGRGTTIYIIDDGFDIGLEDLAANDRTVETFVVSNDETFPSNFLQGVRQVRPHAVILDEDITKGSHGTKMAIVAAGKNHGIAPKADLYLVKAKGSWLKDPNENFQTFRYMPQAIDRALDQVRSRIQTRRNANNDARSVINMSWGVDIFTEGAFGGQMRPVFNDFFDWCQRMNIPVTVAAGNDPGKFLHDTIPQCLGTESNTIITVGGVERDGTLYRETTLPQFGQAGHMTVFAPARDITVPGKPGMGDTGTSQAAAIVAGLAAYFYSVPGLGLFHHRPPAENMKEFIVNHAWQRIRSVPDSFPLAELDVVYNLGYGDPAHPDSPCAIGFEKRAAENATACSAMSSATQRSTQTPHVSGIGNSTSTASPSGVSSTSTRVPTTTFTTSPMTVTTTVSPPSTPTPSTLPIPAPDRCRLSVNEFDNPDPSNHTSQAWSIGIRPVTNNTILDNTLLCFHGGDANENTGIDIECPVIGEGDRGVLNLRRESDDVLRIIWGDETWTAKDKRCKTVEDWHQSEINHRERARTTVCVFDCKIDWSKPPKQVLDR